MNSRFQKNIFLGEIVKSVYKISGSWRDIDGFANVPTGTFDWKAWHRLSFPWIRQRGAEGTGRQRSPFIRFSLNDQSTNSRQRECPFVGIAASRCHRGMKIWKVIQISAIMMKIIFILIYKWWFLLQSCSPASPLDDYMVPMGQFGQYGSGAQADTPSRVVPLSPISTTIGAPLSPTSIGSQLSPTIPAPPPPRPHNNNNNNNHSTPPTLDGTPLHHNPYPQQQQQQQDDQRAQVIKWD